MGAWKSSEGGGIAELGNSGITTSISTNGKVTLVSAVANVRGIVLHMVRYQAVSGTPTLSMDVYDAGGTKLPGARLMTSVAGTPGVLSIDREIFIPPGHELAFDVANAGSSFLYVRWTIK